MLSNKVLQPQFGENLPYWAGAGALVVTGIAAYLASRPKGEKPLWPLDVQALVLPVSYYTSNYYLTPTTCPTLIS